MRDTILILEDDDARLTRLLGVLSEQHPRYAVLQWRDAHAMIHDLPQHLPAAALMCLDHDLYVQKPTDPDPGDGLDVAKYLAGQSPCCPVLIHSSNTDRANMMLGELQLAAWNCRRLAPIGDDWVEADWAFVIRDLLDGGLTTGCS